jgi:hypothetical protein
MQLPTQFINDFMNLRFVFSPSRSLFDRCGLRIVAGDGKLMNEAYVLPRTKGPVVIEQLTRQRNNMIFLGAQESLGA